MQYSLTEVFFAVWAMSFLLIGYSNLKHYSVPTDNWAHYTGNMVGSVMQSTLPAFVIMFLVGAGRAYFA